MKTLTLLTLSSFVLLSGCYLQKTKDNVRLNPNQIQEIVVGKTTIGEAFAILGSPTRSIKLLENEAYVFEHKVAKRTGMFALLITTQRIDNASDSVTLIVDRGGIVRAIGTRFDSDEANYGTPWGE